MTGVPIVTGTGSGLGRFLHRALGGEAVERGTPLAGLRAPLIVHCAANARRDASPRDLREDNVGLTERLLALPHERFIYVSTVEAPAARTDYARAKLEAEGMVLALGRRPLVLRCGALLGTGMRPNALTRVLEEAPLSLTGSSTFAWILYEDVLAFQQAALDRSLEGVYNLIPSRSSTLDEAARALGRRPTWGAYEYRTPEADSGPARAVCPAFSRTALENAQLFARGWPR